MQKEENHSDTVETVETVRKEREMTTREDQIWIDRINKQKEAQRRWRSKPGNKEKMQAAHDRWTAAHPDKVKAYRTTYNKKRWSQLKAARARLQAEGKLS